MSISPRDQRVLREIASEISAAEPRLARALTTGRLPALRGRLVAAGAPRVLTGIAWQAPLTILLCLVTGIGMLTAGLVCGIIPLIWVGATLTQFSPAVLGYLYRRSLRSRPVRR